MTRVYYLYKGRSVELRFDNNQVYTFAPSAEIPAKYVENLLTKQVTVGGCCNKPSRTFKLFATEEQLQSGERSWIT